MTRSGKGREGELVQGRTPEAGPPVLTLKDATKGLWPQHSRAWYRSVAVRALQHVPVLAMMIAYAYHFGQITVDTLRSYQQDAYDMAIPDQGIWLLSRFHAPFVTVMGKDLFGDHTSFIFVLLVPLFWVYPHTAALLVVQAMSLALGALPIYLLARHLLGSTVLATLLAGAYLLNPALQQGNLEQFHVEAFEAPMLAFTVYAIVTWRPRLLVAMVILLLACKQDDFLYVVPIGMWVAWRGHQRMGAAIAGAGAAVALFENLFLVPLLLNGIPTTYAGWVPFGGVQGFLDTLVRQPGQFWTYFVSQGRPWYLWQMGFSTGLAGLLAPWVLVVALPELAFNTLSDFGYQHQIVRHYSMPLVALLVCASTYAISRLARPRWQLLATVGVTLCALWSCVLWGDLPFSDGRIPNLNPDNPVVKGINRLVAEIPPTAVVSAAQNFVPNLDHRVQIYMFPTPFSQSYYGNPKYDGERLRFASQVQYILLPSCLACSPDTAGSAATLHQIESQYRVIGRTSGAVLYERRAPKPH